MKILDLPLKKQWYQMIESGIKTEEYREIKPYWIKRLCQCKGSNNPLIGTGFYCQKANCYRCLVEKNGLHSIKFDAVRFRYGYTPKTMMFKLNSISIGVGNPEWGASKEKVFIIKIGEKINISEYADVEDFLKLNIE